MFLVLNIFIKMQLQLRIHHIKDLHKDCRYNLYYYSYKTYVTLYGQKVHDANPQKAPKDTAPPKGILTFSLCMMIK